MLLSAGKLQADAWYHLWLLAAVPLYRCAVLRLYLFWLELEIALQLFSYLFDFIKYRRPSSLHTYSPRFWGFTLFVMLFSLLVCRQAGPWILLMAAAGLFTFVECLLIKCVLPMWQHDVPSLRAALRLRAAKLDLPD